ncbi:MAG: thioredoxin domain-containing protein, partial [Candidatus Promineifilaceae bacterium]|nr:thioredoxin domain-containing protein [Candidatus Promineifilaceae bacterium]
MHRRPVIALILSLGLMTLILAACGTAAPYAPQESTESPPANPAQTGQEASPVTAPEADSGAVVPVNEEVSPIETQASTVDSRGIEIGFTADGNAYRGSPDAPVVIEEFSDFQCPYCSRFTSQTLPSLEENQIANGEVLLVYYDFPLESIHPQAFAAANAARCAGAQSIEAYWQMHDLLYANPQQWSNTNHNQAFITFADQLELDIKVFTTCVEENQHREKVQADIDLALSRGVRSTPSFFVNGQSLVGAQPVSVFNQAIDAVKSGETLASNAEPVVAPEDAPLPLEAPRIAPTPASIDEDTMAAALGDENAPITIVEFSDYQCPFCRRHVQETMPLMLAEMIETGRVRYVFKDLPLDSLHPEARAAANAARCAGEQDAYWEMHDALFDSQEEWGGQGVEAKDSFVAQAEELNLDREAFSACLEAERYAAVIQENVDEARSLGASATPYFFVDGMPIAGAQSFELFFYAVELAEEGLLVDAYDPGEPDISESY